MSAVTSAGCEWYRAIYEKHWIIGSISEDIFYVLKLDVRRDILKNKKKKVNAW